MAPIVDGLEAEYGDRVIFKRMNVNEADGSAAAQAYRVRGHPAIVVLDAGGNLVWSRVGVQPRQAVAGALESALSNN
jgi:thioredoxin-like negative regulator of GroEL